MKPYVCPAGQCFSEDGVPFECIHSTRRPGAKVSRGAYFDNHEPVVGRRSSRDGDLVAIFDDGGTFLALADDEISASGRRADGRQYDARSGAWIRFR